MIKCKKWYMVINWKSNQHSGQAQHHKEQMRFLLVLCLTAANISNNMLSFQNHTDSSSNYKETYQFARGSGATLELWDNINEPSLALPSCPIIGIISSWESFVKLAAQKHHKNPGYNSARNITAIFYYHFYHLGSWKCTIQNGLDDDISWSPTAHTYKKESRQLLRTF